jgi:hypothetical protein
MPLVECLPFALAIRIAGEPSALAAVVKTHTERRTPLKASLRQRGEAFFLSPQKE